VRSIAYIILKNYFPMKVVAIGGAGFIGSHLVREEKI